MALQHLDSTSISNQSGSITYDTTLFGTVDISRYVKYGNIVEVHFRGQLSSEINNTTEFLTLPFTKNYGGQLGFIAYGTNHYFPTNVIPLWAISGATVKPTATVASGNWIHISFTYIANS